MHKPWLSKAASDGCVVDAFVSKSQRQARDTNVRNTLSSFKRETLQQKTSIIMLEHTVRQVWGKLVQVWVDGVYAIEQHSVM